MIIRVGTLLNIHDGDIYSLFYDDEYSEFYMGFYCEYPIAESSLNLTKIILNENNIDSKRFNDYQIVIDSAIYKIYKCELGIKN